MKIARIIALALVLVLLVACGEPSVRGTWKVECDLSQYVAEGMGGNLEIDASLVTTLTLQFKEDGTYTFDFDHDQFRESAGDYVNALMDFLVEQAYSDAEAEGTSREEFDKQVEESIGMSLQEYIAQNFDPDEMIDEIMKDSEFAASGVYKYSEGKLMMAEETISEDNYYEVVLEDGKLTLQTAHGDLKKAADLEQLLPLTFEKGE